MRNKKKHAKRKKSVAKSRAKRKVTKIKAASKKRQSRRKKMFSPKRKRVTSTGVVAETLPVSSGERLKPRDEESGDLQGLDKPAIANSQSVEELVEEGNAFEAEAVEGVETAPNADQGEVKTHEVPEDDVP